MNWISVKDRLPEEGKEVLVICRQTGIENFIDVARYEEGEFISLDYNDYVVFNVKAWIYFDDIEIPKELR